MRNNKEYLQILIISADMYIYHIKDNRIKSERHFDLLDLNKDYLSCYLNHYDYLNIITNIKDLRYLRKLGIRI